MIGLPPVIDRELGLRARQGATYCGRCAVAAVAALVTLQEMAVAGGTLAPLAVGAAAFSAVGWLGFLVACGSAFVTADCLSRERREGTLGLLLLTDLNSFEVVFGKMCVAGLSAAYGLISFLPALILVILAGGVSFWEICRTALSLLNATFIALAAGIWISGRSQSRSEAVRRTVITLILLCIVPRIAMQLGIFLTRHASWIASLSPYSGFLQASDSEYIGEELRFWITLAVGFLEGWLLLALTGLRLRQNWKAIEWTPPRKPKVWEPAYDVEAQELAAKREELKKNDPLCWAMSRMRMQNALIWGGAMFLLFSGTGFSWALMMLGPLGGTAGIGVWNGIHLLFSLAAAALLAWAAGRFFYDAQRNGELELLLSTPVGGKEIVTANWRALCLPLRGAWLLVAFLILVQFALLPTSTARSAGGSTLFGPVEKLLPIIMRVMDIIALCWMGMWFGLQARKPLSIIAWPAGLVVGIPWLLSYIFIICITLGSSSPLRNSAPSLTLGFWLLLWPIMNLFKDIVLIGWAVNRLKEDLRTKVSLAVGELTK